MASNNFKELYGDVDIDVGQRTIPNIWDRLFSGPKQYSEQKNIPNLIQPVPLRSNKVRPEFNNPTNINVGRRTIPNKVGQVVDNAFKSPTEYTTDVNNTALDREMGIEANARKGLREQEAITSEINKWGNYNNIPAKNSEYHGSERMKNYYSPITPKSHAVTQYDNTSGNSPMGPLPHLNEPFIGPSEYYDENGMIINQGAGRINSGVKGSAAMLHSNAAAEDERRTIEASEAYDTFYKRNPKNTVPTSTASSVSYTPPTAPSAKAKASPYGYNPYSGKELSNWRDKYDVNNLSIQSTPKQNNRISAPSPTDIQRQKFAANQSAMVNDVGKFNKLGSNASTPGFNTTSDNQMVNNGNVNNAANMYRSSTPAKKNNGFF